MLFKAIEKSDMINSMIALSLGANVNWICEKSHSQTALHVASGTGNLSLVVWLTLNGATVDVKDDRGYSPLDLAISAKKLKIQDWLVKKGGGTAINSGTAVQPESPNVGWKAVGRKESMPPQPVVSGLVLSGARTALRSTIDTAPHTHAPSSPPPPPPKSSKPVAPQKNNEVQKVDEPVTIIATTTTPTTSTTTTTAVPNNPLQTSTTENPNKIEEPTEKSINLIIKSDNFTHKVKVIGLTTIGELISGKILPKFPTVENMPLFLETSLYYIPAPMDIPILNLELVTDNVITIFYSQFFKECFDIQRKRIYRNKSQTHSSGGTESKNLNHKM